MSAVVETVRQMQAAAWANKTVKGFNTADVALEFGLLHGELAEAFDAWRRNQVSLMAVELADVAIYLFGLAEMAGIDLQDEIAFKLAVNVDRRYRRDSTSGTLVKEPGQQATSPLAPACPSCGSHEVTHREFVKVKEGYGSCLCVDTWHNLCDRVGDDAR
jgi:NTP pyrophosphatase (non-canonical NTP hydrolase)